MKENFKRNIIIFITIYVLLNILSFAFSKSKIADIMWVVYIFFWISLIIYIYISKRKNHNKNDEKKVLNERTETGLILLYVILFMISFASFVFFNPIKLAFSKYVNQAKEQIISNDYETGAVWDKKTYKNDDGTFSIGFKIDKYKWSSVSGKISGGNISFYESDIKPNYIGIIIGTLSLVSGVVIIMYIQKRKKK